MLYNPQKSVFALSVLMMSCLIAITTAKIEDNFGTLEDVTNSVNSVAKAQEILRRYGYLRCGGPVPKRKKTAFQALIEPPPQVTKIYGPCSEESFKRALKQYQQTYNMAETGLLDHDTLQMMGESRCGNPDDENMPAKPMFRTKRGRKWRKKFASANGRSNGNRHRRPKRDANQPITHLEHKVIAETIHSVVIVEEPSERAHIRRKRWINQRETEIQNGVFDKKLEEIYKRFKSLRKRRSKRSTQEISTAFPSDVVTWRMVNSAISDQLSLNSQRTAFALGFRMWGEVIPLIFHEDTKSPVDEVDILLAFGKGEHLNCPNNFDGFGGQLSHAVRSVSSAEIHVDDDEHLTIQGSEQGTNLVKVAVHEVGHALGLHHTSLNSSIMYAIYSQVIPNINFELDMHDRRMVQAIYGICRGKFDTVFDWVRRRPEDGQLIFNSYFFRSDRFWMYENRANRTRFGDPLSVAGEWKGIPNKIDAYAHVWNHEHNSVYFFKGRHYWLYDSYTDQTAPGYPRNISDDFGPISGTNFPSIPTHLDTAIFDLRDGNLYFFKGNLVYAYDVNRGREGCCLPGYPRELSQEFPMSPTGSEPPLKLPTNLDAAYYSYADKTMYFFKGSTFYQNVAYNPLDRRRTNRIKGPKDVALKWKDICNAELN